MRTLRTLAGLALCAVIAAGCGEDEEKVQAAKPTVSLAERQAELERDPYGLRCADLGDEIASARMTRIVQYALADDAKIRGLNRLRASQSIYYAITEICKGEPGSFQPANAAIAGVRSGEYRADLNTP
jgi:hypothetical protein